MSEILLYAISVMYSPGPVNFISLNQGMQKQTQASSGFFAGVGTAMLILLTAAGFTGASIIQPEWLFFIAIPGCLYIIWLAMKIFRASTRPTAQTMPPQLLTFKDGFMMQLLNPKGFIAIIPISTIQFPAAGITGWHILLWSVGLSLLAFGAPLSYAIAGSLIGRNINSQKFFKATNLLLATILVFVALRLGYTQTLDFLGQHSH